MRTPTARDVLRDAVRGQRRLVTASGALAAGHQLGEAAVPVLIGVVVDRFMDGDGGAEGLAGALVLLGGVFAFLSLSFRYSLQTGETAAFRAAHLLRLRVANHLLDARGARTGRLTGELVDISTDDAQFVGDVNLAWPRAVAAVVALVASGAALLWYSLLLGSIVLITAPVLLWLSHRTGRPLTRQAEAGQRQAAAASGLATDLVAGIQVLKGIGAESAAAERYRATSRRSRDAAIRVATARSRLDGSMIVMTGLLLAVVAAVGGRLAATGRISIGDLVAVLGLAQFLVWPLSQFSWVNGQLAGGRASAGRIADLLAAPPATAGGTWCPEVCLGEVRVDGLGHGHLTKLEFTVAPGEFVGLVAPSAETGDLLDCLRRAVVPERGAVTVDGVPLTEFDPTAARRVLLLVEHDTDLFVGTVAENVAGWRTEVPRHPRHPAIDLAVDSAIDSALDSAQVHGLADGADTAVGPRGLNLSGGQRQRVALARAIVADPPVLVLHDPTTAVDAVTESAVAAGLRAARRGRSTLLITTSATLLDQADRVVYVRDGAVVATGRHRDLAAADPGYRVATH